MCIVREYRGMNMCVFFLPPSNKVNPEPKYLNINNICVSAKNPANYPTTKVFMSSSSYHLWQKGEDSENNNLS